MKNILNVNKISLKPIFMSLAILFTAGVSFPNHFEKVASASYSDSQTPKTDETIEKEDENFDDLDDNGGKKFSCGDCITAPLKKISNFFSSNKENPNNEIIIEEEEEVPDSDDGGSNYNSGPNNDGVLYRGSKMDLK